MKISVVMGVYNAGAILRKTLASLLAQTEPDFEVIAVDDASTDETGAILADFMATDPRVRTIRENTNVGLTRALITGCAAARGKYIARQDAGDISLPERFSQQSRLMDSGVTFVSCATEYVGPESEPLWVAHPTGAASAPTCVLESDGTPTMTDGPTSHPSVMFRRDAYERVGGYRTEFYYGQDFDLWYRFAATGTFQSLPQVLYQARVTPGSISGSARIEQEALASLSLAAARARARGEPEDEILAEAAKIRPPQASANLAPSLYFIGEVLRHNRDSRSVRYFRQSIAANPFAAKAWFRLMQSLVLWRR